MPDLNHIIDRCIRKDKTAQKMLYNLYASTLLGICFRYARDRTEAEDILQDGFVKIFTHIEKFEGKGSFEGWMKRIIVNTAITHYHQNLKHYYHQDFDEISETKTLNNTNADFTQAELLQVINELPSGFRIIFNMYVVEGYKHKEIAQMLDIDIGTSKSQFSRAKRLIRKRLLELSKEAIL
jgi:RNA polymerase sigma-70 factor (ECF subfamily)